MHLFFHFLFPFLLISPLWIYGQSLQEQLQEAHASYQQGEKATSYQERKIAFNKALSLYHNLEKAYPRSADLNQALADTYFQLGEYAWAILYYQRALKNNEHDALALNHLAKAQAKLDLPVSAHQAQQFPFLFSLSQHMNLIFEVILLTFLAFSGTIWLSFVWLRPLAWSCAVLLAFLLSNALFFYYSTPVEGILIQASGFYRAPGWNQSQLTSQPLLAGSNVHIIQMTQDGDWLKIEKDGLIGYISTQHLRPI